jgi:hypothetical protein
LIALIHSDRHDQPRAFSSLAGPAKECGFHFDHLDSVGLKPGPPSS